MNELKARGVADVLIAAVDAVHAWTGLKGFPDAIEAVFPEAAVQTCIAHLIRRSLAYASYKERRPLAAALKAIYRAPTEAAAAAALDALEAGPLPPDAEQLNEGRGVDPGDTWQPKRARRYPRCRRSAARPSVQGGTKGG